jgi:hypothetical protein
MLVCGKSGGSCRSVPGSTLGDHCDLPQSLNNINNDMEKAVIPSARVPVHDYCYYSPANRILLQVHKMTSPGASVTKQRVVDQKRSLAHSRDWPRRRASPTPNFSTLLADCGGSRVIRMQLNHISSGVPVQQPGSSSTACKRVTQRWQPLACDESDPGLQDASKSKNK